MDQKAFVAAAEGLGLSPSPEQLGLLDSFEERLYEANKVKNLTRVPREEAWLRHYIDSLLHHDLIPSGSAVLDIGTGPGFPAWPLACMRPDLTVTALDSNGKMVAFLESVSLPNLKPMLGRAEELPMRERFDVVTGRAVAPLSIQLEISAPLARVGGLVIPMRTAKDEAVDPTVLGLDEPTVFRRLLPGLGAERVFPVFRKLSKTPPKYARAWAEITRGPLPTTGEPL